MVLLVLAGIAFIGFLQIWTSSPAPEPLAKNRPAEESKGYRSKVEPQLTHYNIVVQKDLFLPSRHRNMSLGGGSRMQPTVAVKAPQGLTLVGTVLLSDKKLAIILSNKIKGKSASYKIGDSIEGFTVKGIEKDKVVLYKFGQTAELTLKSTKHMGAISSVNSRVSPRVSFSGSKIVTSPAAPVRKPPPLRNIGQKTL